MISIKHLDGIASALVIVAALNWGFVGLFDYNLVTALLGGFPMIVTIVYALFGISGVYFAFTLVKGK